MLHHLACGGFQVRGNNGGWRTFARKSYKKWPGGVVPYSVVSDGSDSSLLDGEAFFVDSKVGFNRQEWLAIKKAMKTIEDHTCIRFQNIDPRSGQRWVNIMREGEALGRKNCWRKYINKNLAGRNIRSLSGNQIGSVFPTFTRREITEGCFTGGYVTSSTKITYLVMSNAYIAEQSEDKIGFIMHECLHAIGLSHTQKRAGLNIMSVH